MRATVCIACAVWFAALCPSPTRAAAPSPENGAAPRAVRWHSASTDEYRRHLGALMLLVEACAKGRDLQSCDPLKVGLDDRVPVGAAAPDGRRLVRYGWLRVLLSRAEDPDAPPVQTDASTRNTRPGDTTSQSDEPTTSQLLEDARIRLAFDLAEAGTGTATLPQHRQERATMQQVLAGRDFEGLTQPSATDSLKEKIVAWLNKIFQNASSLRAGSAWVGRLAVWGFILALCVGLVLGLLRLERRWRVRLTLESELPFADGAAHRDWQLWLEEARRAAAGGAWRQAIHSAYWAAIARLEGRRLWPPDRARTPREYLAQVAFNDPRRAGLTQLTRSFESTWYGGIPVSERDYRMVEDVASSLIGGDTSAGKSTGGVQWR